MNTPKVSVIIPVYNTEKYLRECLDSVANQTLRDIEIICVDDGSTDNSLAILREYAAKDNRVTVLTQKNINAGAARNHGMLYAKGKYLSFLDSDDYFDLCMLSDCVQKMESEKADIVCFAARQKDMRNGRTSDMPWSLDVRNLPNKACFSPNEIPTKIFNTFQNWPWNKMFRREFIEKNGIRFQEIPRTNDMLFTCSALVLAERIAVIKKAYVFYRIGTGTSLQQTNNACPLSFWDAFRETKAFLMERELYARYEQSFINWIACGMYYNYRSIKDPTASAAVFCCIKYRGEQDFNLLKYDKSYYYNPYWLASYKSILEQDVWSCIGLSSQRTAPTKSRRVLLKAQQRIRDSLCFYHEHGLRYTLNRMRKK